MKIWLEARTAGASATANEPFEGLISDKDMETLEETLTLYPTFSGLDDPSLESMIKDLHVSVEKF